jgi:hypothetical protein
MNTTIIVVCENGILPIWPIKFHIETLWLISIKYKIYFIWDDIKKISFDFILNFIRKTSVYSRYITATSMKMNINAANFHETEWSMPLISFVCLYFFSIILKQKWTLNIFIIFSRKRFLSRTLHTTANYD